MLDGGGGGGQAGRLEVAFHGTVFASFHEVQQNG